MGTLVQWQEHLMLVVKPYITGQMKDSYQNIGQCNLNITYIQNRFSHEIIDLDGLTLRRFYSYEGAKDFIYNKPECKIRKITFDLSTMEECLF